MNLPTTRRSGHTTAMIGMMLVNTKAVLICGSNEHAQILKNQFPQLRERFLPLHSVSITQSRTKDVIILYDNFAIDVVNAQYDSLKKKLSDIKVRAEFLEARGVLSRGWFDDLL